MKKAWLAALVAVIASPSLFAQQPQENYYIARVAEKVQQAETQDVRTVLEKMQTVTVCWEEQQDEASKKQALLSFLQAFDEYVTKYPGLPAWKLTQLITSEINMYIKHDSERLAAEPSSVEGSGPARTLEVYRAMELSFKEAENYAQLKNGLDGFLRAINEMNAQGKTCPDNVNQALIPLAKQFSALYELAQGGFREYDNPNLNLGASTIRWDKERFVAKNPELAKAVARVLNVEVTIGGQAKSLAAWARQSSEWEPLAKFADALEGNIY